MRQELVSTLQDAFQQVIQMLFLGFVSLYEPIITGSEIKSDVPCIRRGRICSQLTLVMMELPVVIQ